MVRGGRFRVFRGNRTRGRGFDGDAFDATGEVLRGSYPLDDEGDETLRALIDRLDQIESPDPEDQG